MSIGEQINELRKQQNISQVQLAKALNVSRQAISKWENDQTSPDTINLIRLADVLNTDTEYLVTGKHAALKSPPQVVTVIQKVDNVIEKVVEKPITIEKVVEVERVVEKIVEIPRIKKVTRVKYLRNPIESVAIGIAGLAIGIIIGVIL